MLDPIEIPIEYLRECFECDADLGTLTWKKRPLSHFPDLRSCGMWNTRLAGKPAGTLSKAGYRDVTVACKKFRVHRIIWAMHTGKWPVAGLDHRNRDRLANAIDNLREADQSQNSANQDVSPRNKIGLKGVCAHYKRFRAQIKIASHVIYLGIFDTPQEAHAAYCAAARTFHGEFAGGLCA